MLKIAHRGASGHAAENTYSAFKKAIELKSDVIEFDVRITKDNEVVVIHDNKVNRTTNGNGKVKEKTIHEIKSLSLKNGEKALTIQDALRIINKRVTIDIDVKDKPCIDKISDVINLHVKAGWSYDHFIVSSFRPGDIKKMKSLNKNIKTGLLFHSYTHFLPVYRAKKAGADIIEISIRNVSRKIVEKAHEEGLEVFVYTVDHKEDIERMKSLGVDGIVTNFPDRV